MMCIFNSYFRFKLKQFRVMRSKILIFISILIAFISCQPLLSLSNILTTEITDNEDRYPIGIPPPRLHLPILNCNYQGKFCGGLAGIKCPYGYTCKDNPNDNCDPDNGGADCGGICVKKGCPIKPKKCYVSCGMFCKDTPPRMLEACPMIYIPCIQSKKCEVQSNGQCGWTTTPAYTKCMASIDIPQPID